MKTISPLLLLLIAERTCSQFNFTNDARAVWKMYKNKFQLEYESIAEETRRIDIFNDNLNFINRHNQRYDKGLESYTMDLNEFSHMSFEEFSEIMLPKLVYTDTVSPSRTNYNNISNVPEEMNWNEKGAVSPIKNQGTCGSCWSFTAVAVTESHNFLKTGKMLDLSEQQLVDCDTKQSRGCNGGFETEALNYIKKNGIVEEQYYPYEGQNSHCRFNSSQMAVKISEVVRLPAHDEDLMKKVVGTIGPVTIHIFATMRFQFYSSGVFSEIFCFSRNFANHALVAIGYGTENGKDYWLLKNSWGTSWGENGFGKFARNKRSMCAIAAAPSYPII